MERLYRCLKPLANIYVILLAWILLTLNFYIFMKPLYVYAESAGLKTTPIVLDAMTYYTPDEGYQALTTLGPNGRHAYRLANYTDLFIPILLFLSLSLPHIAMGKGSRYILGPLICMISDYSENIAEKYVLEIYPKRNDFMMTLACYFGLIKFASFLGSGFTVIINLLQWMFQPRNQLPQKNE